MGCDIHTICEKRNPKTGKWEKVGEHFSTNEFDKKRGRDKTASPFSWRSYSMFGFLADVYNYSLVPPLSEARGLPTDSEYLNELDREDEGDWFFGMSRRQSLLDADYFGYSWLTLKELADFDYSKTFEDRRTTLTVGNFTNGAADAKEGEGVITSYRDFLGKGFFEHLEEMKELGDPENVRIVFWFDN